jgi:hypothetical protein
LIFERIRYKLLLSHLIPSLLTIFVIRHLKHDLVFIAPTPPGIVGLSLGCETFRVVFITFILFDEHVPSLKEVIGVTLGGLLFRT